VADNDAVRWLVAAFEKRQRDIRVDSINENVYGPDGRHYVSLSEELRSDSKQTMMSVGIYVDLKSFNSENTRLTAVSENIISLG